MKLTETYKTIIAEQKWYEAVKDSLAIAASPVIGSVVLLKKAMQLSYLCVQDLYNLDLTKKDF